MLKAGGEMEVKLLQIIEKLADYCDDKLPLPKNTMLIAKIKPNNPSPIRNHPPKYSGNPGSMFIPMNNIDLPYRTAPKYCDVKGPIKILRNFNQ